MIAISCCGQVANTPTELDFKIVRPQVDRLMRILHGTVPADFKFVNMESKTSCLFANRQESVVVGTNTGTIYHYDNYEWPPAPIDKKARPLDNESAMALAKKWADIFGFPKNSKITRVLFDWQRGPTPDPSRSKSSGDQVVVSFDIPIHDFYASGGMKFRSVDGRLLTAFQPPKRGIRNDSGLRFDERKVKEDYVNMWAGQRIPKPISVEDIDVKLVWMPVGDDEAPDGIPTYIPMYEAYVNDGTDWLMKMTYFAETGKPMMPKRLSRKPSSTNSGKPRSEGT